MDLLSHGECEVNFQGLIVYICIPLTFCGFFGTFCGQSDNRGGAHNTSAIEDIKLATQAYFAPRAYIIKNFSDYVKEVARK